MPPLPAPLNGLLALPSEVVAALKTLQAIARNTGAMETHTASLRDVTRILERVASDTGALPSLRQEMAGLARATAVLEPMDGRMASIEAAMPALLQVQEQLATLPDTMRDLDDRLARLSQLLERMLLSLDGLATSVDELQQAVGPMGRLASRLPGRGRRGLTSAAPSEEDGSDTDRGG